MQKKVQMCMACNIEIAQIKCPKCPHVIYFCDACYAFLHKSGVNQSHHPEIIAPGASQPENKIKRKNEGNLKYCDIHQDRELEYFCNDCARPICSDCLVSPIHKSHDAITISLIIENQSLSINEGIEKCQYGIKNIESIKLFSNKIIDNISSLITKMKEEIKSTFTNLFNLLLQKQNEILHKIDIMVEPNCKVILEIKSKLEINDTLLKDMCLELKENQKHIFETISLKQPFKESLKIIENIIKSIDFYSKILTQFSEETLLLPLFNFPSIEASIQNLDQNLFKAEAENSNEKSEGIYVGTLSKTLSISLDDSIMKEEKSEELLPQIGSFFQNLFGFGK